MSSAIPMVVGVLCDDPETLKAYLIASVDGNDYWPVGSPIGIRSIQTGNLLALGRVENSAPGKAQILVIQRFD